MPDRLAIAEAAHGLPVHDDVRHDGEIRITGNPGLAFDVDRGLVELTETAAEREQLILGQILIAEAQDEVRHPRVEDRFECGVAERPGEIDTSDFGSDVPPQGMDAYFCSFNDFHGNLRTRKF